MLHISVLVMNRPSHLLFFGVFVASKQSMQNLLVCCLFCVYLLFLLGGGVGYSQSRLFHSLS